MIIKDIIFQLSVRSVRLHFLRSVLAALGIVIGVVAIASMGMMGANMTLSVTEELSSMANILVVRPDIGFGGGGGDRPVMVGMSSSSTEEMITEEQFRDIEQIAGKYGLVYAVNSRADRIEIGDSKGRSTIYGLDPVVFPEIFTLADGAFPKSTSSVMIGPDLADRFGLTLGSKLDIGEENDIPYIAMEFLEGETVAESQARCERMQAERGLTLVHPYDDARIIAGQGTLGLEILEDLPEVDTVVVPVGGGGLAAGLHVHWVADHHFRHVVLADDPLQFGEIGALVLAPDGRPMRMSRHKKSPLSYLKGKEWSNLHKIIPCNPRAGHKPYHR